MMSYDYDVNDSYRFTINKLRSVQGQTFSLKGIRLFIAEACFDHGSSYPCDTSVEDRNEVLDILIKKGYIQQINHWKYSIPSIEFYDAYFDISDDEELEDINE